MEGGPPLQPAQILHVPMSQLHSMEPNSASLLYQPGAVKFVPVPPLATGGCYYPNYSHQVVSHTGGAPIVVYSSLPNSQVPPPDCLLQIGGGPGAGVGGSAVCHSNAHYTTGMVSAGSGDGVAHPSFQPASLVPVISGHPPTPAWPAPPSQWTPPMSEVASPPLTSSSRESSPEVMMRGGGEESGREELEPVHRFSSYTKDGHRVDEQEEIEKKDKAKKRGRQSSEECSSKSPTGKQSHQDVAVDNRRSGGGGENVAVTGTGRASSFQFVERGNTGHYPIQDMLPINVLKPWHALNRGLKEWKEMMENNKNGDLPCWISNCNLLFYLNCAYLLQALPEGNKLEGKELEKYAHDVVSKILRSPLVVVYIVSIMATPDASDYAKAGRKKIRKGDENEAEEQPTTTCKLCSKAIHLSSHLQKVEALAMQSTKEDFTFTEIAEVILKVYKAATVVGDVDVWMKSTRKNVYKESFYFVKTGTKRGMAKFKVTQQGFLAYKSALVSALTPGGVKV
mmetsp:Transcript_5460/g.12383  ORF Transcript_5460/g.12383 Transcript_5460/m.12383 type:complete len:509 (-) Transcript_5460:205-1731(-)